MGARSERELVRHVDLDRARNEIIQLCTSNPTAEGLSAVREWMLAILRDEPSHAAYYRISSHDAGDDLVKMVRTTSHDLRSGVAESAEARQAVHDLKRAWRFLVRRYAWGASFEVWRILRPLDLFVWSFQRIVSMCLPRLGIAVFAGVVAVLGSSELADILGGISKSGRWLWLVLGSFVCAAYLLDVLEVQRRVGRDVPRVLIRAAGVTFAGSIYAALLTCLVARPAWHHLKQAPEWTSNLAWTVGASALLLAHVIQLFWLEESVGEPL